MKDEFCLNGNYAGDSAWREWFAMCAVGRCSAANGGRLRTQVASAMLSRLARYGLSRADAGGDDPVAAFDAYFRLKGSRDEKKPLKLYFAHRIRPKGCAWPILCAEPSSARFRGASTTSSSTGSPR